MESVMAIFALIFVGATIMSYILFCGEYPRYKDDHYKMRNDPLWMSILKLWGGVLVFVCSFIFWGNFFSWMMNKWTT